MLRRLRSGEIVGEMSFVDSRPPSASVISLERSVVLAIPPRHTRGEAADDVAFAARFYRSLAVFLSDRLRTTSGRLGYGGTAPEQPEADDEMDPATGEPAPVGVRAGSGDARGHRHAAARVLRAIAEDDRWAQDCRRTGGRADLHRRRDEVLVDSEFEMRLSE